MTILMIVMMITTTTTIHILTITRTGRRSMKLQADMKQRTFRLPVVYFVCCSWFVTCMYLLLLCVDLLCLFEETHVFGLSLHKAAL